MAAAAKQALCSLRLWDSDHLHACAAPDPPSFPAAPHPFLPNLALGFMFGSALLPFQPSPAATLLQNLAVSSIFGAVDASLPSVLPQELLVDYVRLYQVGG